jgi:hypothetical protein
VRAAGPTDRGFGPPSSRVACQRPSVGLGQQQLAEKKEEEERDYWFNCLQPMSKPKQMWQEKWLAKEKNGSIGDSSGEEEVEVTSDKGGSNLESGKGNLGLGNGNPGKEEDWRRSNQPGWMSTWCSRSRQSSVHQQRTLQS